MAPKESLSFFRLVHILPSAAQRRFVPTRSPAIFFFFTQIPVKKDKTSLLDCRT